MLGTTSTTMLDRIHKAHRGLRLLDVLLSAALAIGLMLSVGSLSTASVAAKSSALSASKAKLQTWQVALTGYRSDDIKCKPSGVCDTVTKVGHTTFEKVTYTVTHVFHIEFSGTALKVIGSGSGHGGSGKGKVTITEKIAGTGLANAPYPTATSVSGSVTFTLHYEKKGKWHGPFSESIG